MNTGTKIRTALRIAVSLNTAIYAVSAAVGALGFGWLTMAWAIFTIISDFAVSALTIPRRFALQSSIAETAVAH